MIIRTVKQHGEFVVMPKAAINDDGLSWEARGVLAYLLEKPDGWKIYQSDLVKRGPARDYKIRHIMAELEAAGYVVRRLTNGNDGKFIWETEVYETPQPVGQPSTNNHHMVRSPSREKPRVGKPRVGKPRVGKPRVGNREISKQQQNLGLTESIPDSSEQQQQQQQAPAEPDTVSGDAAAAVLLSPEQKTALGLMAWNVPAFTAPESFVLRYDPKLIGYWCIAIDAMSGEELEAIKSLPAFLYSMVKRGEWPSLPGRLADRWQIAMDKIVGDAPQELDY